MKFLLFRHLSVNNAKSPINDPTHLSDRIQTAIRVAERHFRANLKGDDCQHQINALCHCLLGNSIDTIPAVPSQPAYMLQIDPLPVKSETGLSVVGQLFESETAATSHEYAAFPFVDTTENAVTESICFTDSTALNLYGIPQDLSRIEAHIKDRYQLDREVNEFAVIEIGLWEAGSGHAVCYIHQKSGGSSQSYFCDPTQNRIDNDGRFFESYTNYKYLAFKSLYIERTSPQILVKEEPLGEDELVKKRSSEEVHNRELKRNRISLSQINLPSVSPPVGASGQEMVDLTSAFRTKSGSSEITDILPNGSIRKGMGYKDNHGNTFFTSTVTQTYPDGVVIHGKKGYYPLNSIRGIQYLPDGTTLEGLYDNFKNSGQGFCRDVKQTLPDGTVFKGNYGPLRDGTKARGFNSIVTKIKDGIQNTGRFGDIGDGTRGFIPDPTPQREAG